MRKLSLLMVVALLTFACSSDDDTAAPPQTQTELLVSGSPWNFSSAELVTIISNDANFTNAEMLDITQNASFPQFNFNSNGTVLLTNNGNEVTANFNIVNGNMTISLDGDSLTLENVNITGNEFSYEVINDAIPVGGNTSQVSVWRARLFYN